MTAVRAAERITGRLEALGALRHAPYRRVWIAFMVSQVGQWMQITARAVLVFEITGSASALGFVYLASYSPQLLFSLLGGALADRFDRRHLVIASSSAQAGFAVLFGVLAATDTATLANLMALSFVVGIFQTVMMPAQLALLPALVPRRELHSAVSLQSTSVSISRILGPLAAGAIIPLWGVDLAFFINAVSFFATISAWVRTRVEQPVDRSAPPLRAALEGLRYIARTPALRVPLAMMAFLSAIGLVYQPLGVAYATDVLAGGSESLGSSYYGSIQAAIGIGSIIGIVSLAGVGKRRPALVALGTGAAFGGSLATLGAVGSIAVALVVTFAIGMFHFSNATLIQTLVQHVAPEVMRGRVMSAFQLAFVGLFPFTSALFGWAADRTSVQTTFGATGLAIVVFCLLLLRWRRDFRTEPAEEPAPDDPEAPEGARGPDAARTAGGAEAPSAPGDGDAARTRSAADPRVGSRDPNRG